MQAVKKNKSSAQSNSGRNSVTLYYNKNGRQSRISKSPSGPTLSEAQETELEANPKKNMAPENTQPSIRESPATAKQDDVLY